MTMYSWRSGAIHECSWATRKNWKSWTNSNIVLAKLVVNLPRSVKVFLNVRCLLYLVESYFIFQQKFLCQNEQDSLIQETKWSIESGLVVFLLNASSKWIVHEALAQLEWLTFVAGNFTWIHAAGIWGFIAPARMRCCLSELTSNLVLKFPSKSS